MPEPSAGKARFRNASKKKTLRKRADSDDDEYDFGASAAIQLTKKKRKILNDLSYKGGLDVKDTWKATISSSETVLPTQEKDASKDPDRARAFSGEAGNRVSTEGVLEKKHKAAMEDFIQKHMKSDEAVEQLTNIAKKPIDLEAKLFEELQSTALRLSGEADVTKEQAEEGDVGAGGAMLGGTGIAEVILPAEIRIAAARATEEANSRMRRGRPGTEASKVQLPAVAMPMSFSIGPGKRSRRQGVIESTGQKKQDIAATTEMSSATILPIQHDLPSSYTHNFTLHSQERRSQLQVGPSMETIISEGRAEGDRMGFVASRQIAKSEDSSTRVEKGFTTGKSKNQPSSDTRVFRDFIKNQREKGF